MMFQSPLENSQIDGQIHAKTALLDNRMNTIIIRRALLKRWCWNWQTGMVEGHVSKDVEVQVLSSAPMEQKSPSQIRGFFCFCWTAWLICLDPTSL